MHVHINIIIMYLDLLAEGGDEGVIGDCRPFSSGADDVHLFLK